MNDELTILILKLKNICYLLFIYCHFLEECNTISDFRQLSLRRQPRRYHQLPQVEHSCVIAYFSSLTVHPAESNSTLRFK